MRKGDEGGWAPKISDLEAFEIVKEATDKVFDETGIEVRMGLDVASSEMWDAEKQRYVYKNAERTTEEQIAYIAELIDDYNLIYVEDPIQEEDFEGFAAITSEVKDRDTLICGDDLFVTNVERLAQGIEMNAGNCVLIKPNQIGTLTDTFETIDLAHR
ncbi:MAG TPA: enolase, partial [Methanocorpusculum sp.]|nr:enolase [Methanocorpusculum sp.]